MPSKVLQPDDVLRVAPLPQRSVDRAAGEVEAAVTGTAHEPDAPVPAVSWASTAKAVASVEATRSW